MRGRPLRAPVRIERRLQFLKRRDVADCYPGPSCPIGRPLVRRFTTARSTCRDRPSQFPGATTVSHRTPVGRRVPPPHAQYQLEPRKTTKGRHLNDKDCRRRQGPRLHAPRDGGGEVSLADFKGASSSYTFIPGPIPPAAPWRPSDFSRLAPAFEQRRNRDSRRVRRSGAASRTSSRPSTIFRSRSASDETHEMLRPTAFGRRNPCTAAATWASCATPI